MLRKLLQHEPRYHMMAGIGLKLPSKLKLRCLFKGLGDK
jgi:hypothetical protein